MCYKQNHAVILNTIGLADFHVLSHSTFTKSHHSLHSLHRSDLPHLQITATIMCSKINGVRLTPNIQCT